MRYYRIILTPPSSFCGLDLDVRLISAVLCVVESDSPRNQLAGLTNVESELTKKGDSRIV